MKEKELFCKKLEFYTNGKVKFKFIWSTRKIKSLFKIVVYHGICSCGNNYIGETIRNIVTRTDEHEQPNSKSEPFKYLNNNPGHHFNSMISRAPSHHLELKILEAYFIKQLNPFLKDYLDRKILTLFRRGIT